MTTAHVDPAQWRAAADAIDAAFTGPCLDRQARYAAAYLRREANQAEHDEPVRPPVVNYAVEVYDDLADEWLISNARTTDRDKATDTMRRHHDRRNRSARVVRSVETYEVVASTDDDRACNPQADA